MNKNSDRGSGIRYTGLHWPGKRSEVDRVILPFQMVKTINESKADKDDTFHNMWQSFRTRKHPALETKCSRTYEKPANIGSW